tara:strand:+ start:334 stop:570 length:237 start_codon:yes stop_codon:yes gene_type:complete
MRFRRIKVETMEVREGRTEKEYAEFCGVSNADFSCGTLRINTRNGRLQGYCSDVIIKVDQAVFIVPKATAQRIISRDK